jgi:hypothetical protein
MSTAGNLMDIINGHGDDMAYEQSDWLPHSIRELPSQIVTQFRSGLNRLWEPAQQPIQDIQSYLQSISLPRLSF